MEDQYDLLKQWDVENVRDRLFLTGQFVMLPRAEAFSCQPRHACLKRKRQTPHHSVENMLLFWANLAAYYILCTGTNRGHRFQVWG